MLKIENAEVVGWEHAIRGMRNPKNSWEKSDSYYALECGKCGKLDECGYCSIEDHSNCTEFEFFEIGPNDHKLMTQLAKGGPVHAKYRRMIVVYLDITAPLYWWKEFDTLKIGTVANSCSTMHKIQAKRLTFDDFSTEHLSIASLNILEQTLDHINKAMFCYRDFGEKEDWWQMIQLLPTSYNQKRTIMLNYEVLVNIYNSRRNHKLDEWHTLCDWIEQLPYSELITGKKVECIKTTNPPVKEPINIEKLLIEKEVRWGEDLNRLSRLVCSKIPLTQEEKDALTRMWNDCGYKGDIEFETFESMSKPED